MAPTKDSDVAVAPAILVVTSNDHARAAILDQLRRRYQEDYDVHCEGSTAPALQRLKNLREGGRDLAVILVDWELTDGTGVELLSQART